ncbi:YbfB/YjiJ family MFS transporter [Hahella sp. NBU794]|uniref:YbfB/YjiJ family MFS transporter n=1 Tax=Hahella sp. NBU794 TaxID=3422590 RepID=UPI003D6F5AB7
MSAQLQRLQVLTAGILSLMLMLGVARFAYTPLLPLMQQQAGLSAFAGGWLASVNYLGYLCGALIAASISSLTLKDKLYRSGLLIALISTAGMALCDNVWVWAFMRFIAGLSSAAGLLIGSGLIMHWLIRNGHRSELGIHFSGVGLGILCCSLAVDLMTPHFDWREQWVALTLCGLLFAIPAWLWLPSPTTASRSQHEDAMQDRPPSRLYMSIFMAAYFCAGVGYVVSATFLVAIVDQQPALQGQGAFVFLLVGAAAAPACILWDLLARRIGDINALIIAAALHALSILAPTQGGLAMALLGGALFGATFMGIVSLVLTMAGRFYPSRPAKMMGKMTLTYGVAQILSPALTGRLAATGGGYADGLYLAAAVMALGVLLLLALKSVEQSERRQALSYT